ncbi:ribonuclease HIII [Streptococcus sp. sy010]|uniref:ribonuclease HIII n=1 Tax=Streptococcus sp. sy010 TaxID=2600148 RepID=UPI0011B540CC|nr:ribonuclease HIII [Streptococcus sp. sy010]TWT16332.1 ribonuclease HIII [Streptococcus sp. sy010]
MNTVVMTLGDGATNQLTTRLYEYQTPNKQAYVQFTAKYQGVTVQLYHSGKIVFQGKEALSVAKAFGYQDHTPKPASQTRQITSMIGTDEVGNGSYFGGLAVVASFVTAQDEGFLKKLGVADSKQLNDAKIKALAPILKEKIRHKALLLTPKKYNELIGQGKPYNAVSVKVALHNQAIFLLLQQGIQPDKIVIDAFTTMANYQKYLKQEKNPIQCEFHLETKAEDNYLAVAVSSIIARQLFLENLEQLGQEVGHQLPSGAGAQSDQVASHILTQQGQATLAKVAKLHFANTNKALNLLKK